MPRLYSRVFLPNSSWLQQLWGLGEVSTLRNVPLLPFASTVHWRIRKDLSYKIYIINTCLFIWGHFAKMRFGQSSGLVQPVANLLSLWLIHMWSCCSQLFPLSRNVSKRWHVAGFFEIAKALLRHCQQYINTRNDSYLNFKWDFFTGELKCYQCYASASQWCCLHYSSWSSESVLWHTRHSSAQTDLIYKRR